MQSNPKNAGEAFLIIQERMRDDNVPVPARENVRQHYDSLSRLAKTLRDLGMDQMKIDEHVVEIFQGYEKELMASIERIKSAGSIQ